MPESGDFCARLNALLQSGASYEFLNLALPYLEKHPGDDHTRLMAVRELVRAGLGLPAVELLEDGGTAVREEPELRRLAGQLRARAGAAPWDAGRFEANLKVLAERGIDVDEVREAWQCAGDRIQLFRDTQSGTQVRVRLPDGPWKWIPALVDHARAAEETPLPADHGEQMPGPYIFAGLDLGWYFTRVYAKSANTFLGYSSAIYIVEPRPEWFAMVLHLHDWTPQLADPRVMPFIGASAGPRFSETLKRDCNLPLPRFIFVAASSPCDARQEIESRLADLQAHRQAIRECGLAEIQARYAHRDAAYWARRFDDALHGLGPPLRVLSTVSTHTTFLQYSMRDAGRAIQALGHEFQLISDPRPFEIVCPSIFHDEIRRFDPDVFFVLDHLRSSFSGILPDGLPILTWDQDALQHVFKAESVATMSELDVVVGLPHVSSIVRDGCNPRQFLAAHMASSPGEFDSTDLTENDLAPYRSDISYVSHGSQTAEEFHQTEAVQYADPNARRLLDALLPLAREHVLAGGMISGSALRGLLAAAEKDTSVHVVDSAMRDRLIGWHLWRLCDRFFRHQALEWAAGYAKQFGRSLRIYGNGWDQHPTLSAFAAGPVQNGGELLRVYRASAINLQLMPAGFIHQRALDGLLAGGFFLTRATRADERDPNFALIAHAIEERGVSSARELLAVKDASVHAAFRLAREHHGYSEPEAEAAFHAIRTDAQLDYPAEVFPHFGDIVFSDAATFAAKAEPFLADPARRAGVAQAMRKTVLERYTHEVAMQRFLSFHRQYLANVARERGVSECALHQGAAFP